MPVANDTPAAIVRAGVPATNNALYREVRHLVGDPAALVELPGDDGRRQRILILRDIEMHRARQHARAEEIACPADYAPAGGLSGDRETATAQAAAECLRRAGVRQAIADRTLPLIYAHFIRGAGIELECDPELGILERRSKDDQEIEWLHEPQQATEGAMQMACRMVAAASAGNDGVLMHDGDVLTSERVRAAIDVWLLERGYVSSDCIVACGPQGADCHNRGSGSLRTGLPVIIDIFPRNRATLYHGDCTRTVVHGEVPPQLADMHRVVVEAKAAATAAVRPGVTGEQVHQATIDVIRRHGYEVGLPPDGAPETYTAMVHGTGHGIGLDVHEPPLLDRGGPPLVVGDALTIEPGLYTYALGGVRVEDMVIVTADGCRNLNSISEGLSW